MLSQSRKKFDTPNRINGWSPWASIALLQLLLMHAALGKFRNLIKVYMLKPFWYLNTPYKCSQMHSPYRSELNGVSIKLLQEYFHAFHFILWEFQFCICKWYAFFCFYWINELLLMKIWSKETNLFKKTVSTVILNLNFNKKSKVNKNGEFFPFKKYFQYFKSNITEINTAKNSSTN